MKHTLLIISISLLLTGAACSKKTTNQNTNQSTGTNLANSAYSNVNDAPNVGSATVGWSFDGANWKSSGTPPACPNPLSITTPVDLSFASAILYPGQTRGGNYKAHGGFIFRGKQNTDVTVRAPMDAVVYNASRYIEAGEVQYLFTFINPCGIAYRFDHLLTLSPAMQEIADTLPAPQVDNSATTMITTGASVTTGDTIATAVGFKNTSNVSVDFGLYDLRTKNTASASASYVSNHSAEYAQHALCWLDLLGGDSAAAKALPGGDQTAGKTSDYCQ